MSVERRPSFERVARVKGTLLEYLSLGASLVGIVALAVLLVYVAVDAFDLASASHEWILTYVGTVVVPLVALFLYSADDPGLTVRVTLALGGGPIASFMAFRLLAAMGGSVPGLTWSVFYLFAFVVPTTAYVLYAGSQGPIGATAVGLLGRLLGGIAAGLALVVLFVVFDPQLWTLAYTLGVLPTGALVAFARRRESSLANRLALPVGIIGFLAATVLDGLLVFYVRTWLLYVWSVAAPVALGVGLLAARERDRREAALVGALAFAVPVAGSLAGTLVGVAPRHALLVLLTLAVPTARFVRRALDADEGALGLVAPLLLAGGAVVGTLVVQAGGFPAPDPWLDWSYVTSAPSRHPEQAGLYPAIVGSIFVICLVAVLSFVLGVGTAVFLEDYTADEGLSGTITRVIQVNVANLAAVPSVVYGLLGLGLFANMLGMGFGTVTTASLTLSLLILPITIISAQEAIRAVPDHLRQGSYAMGATRWQTTKNVVLPEALPGILTGTILALGRAIGETAPLIMIGAPTTVFSPPEGFASRVSAMPMQIYAWADAPQPEFRYGVVAAGVVTLLVVLLALNGTAILIRNRYETEV
ncbi:phosphate ABC transporter permease PtsA [Halobacteriales archaeon QS_1_68_20]|nr:MAG: phosphate ABC transporter permease PtsA [Halobacteriales archaeon QS_1_68_20]